jgi:hypothetical protein
MLSGVSRRKNSCDPSEPAIEHKGAIDQARTNGEVERQSQRPSAAAEHTCVILAERLLV